jgi:hypothetical protein
LPVEAALSYQKITKTRVSDQSPGPLTPFARTRQKRIVPVGKFVGGV